MLDISIYGSLGPDQLQDELIATAHQLSFVYNQLGSLKSDQNSSFLQAYVRSPAGNVAGKTKDAEFQVLDVQYEIIQREYEVLALLTRKELLLCLIK